MLKQWNARLLAISAAVALSACASQQTAAPVSSATSQVNSAYNQATGAVSGAYDQATSAVSGAYNQATGAVSDAYNQATTATGNVYGAPAYNPAATATYTPPAVNTTVANTAGQYGRVGSQYIPNNTPVDKSASLHIVQAGDTVYNISKRYGISQDTLRSLNGLSDNTLSIGQTLRVKPGSGNTVGNATPQVQPTAPVVNTVSTPAVTAPATPVANSNSVAATAPVVAATAPVVAASTSTTTTSTTSTASTSKPAATTTTSTTKTTTSGDSYLPTQNVANIVWQAPTVGKIARSFGGDNKGVDISGTRGQDVVAAAKGQVVYSGSGLRGYGNLVIIQHTPAYLTAYGHNDSLLVKEGESVQRGQVIAKMGQTDSSNGVKLHFEVRENGTPVDPTRFVKF